MRRLSFGKSQREGRGGGKKYPGRQGAKAFHSAWMLAGFSKCVKGKKATLVRSRVPFEEFKK